MSDGKMSGLFGFLRACFTIRRLVPITLVLLILASIGTIASGFQTGNFVPFFSYVGGKLLNHDNRLYNMADQIQKDGGLKVEHKPGTFWGEIVSGWNIFKALLTIFVSLWFMIIFFCILYWISLFIIGDADEIPKRLVVSIVLFVFIEIIAHFVVVDPNLANTSMTMQDKLIPAKGLFKLATVAPLIFKSVAGPNMPGFNQTQNQTSLNETALLNEGVDLVMA
jgi:hypothetical protein